MSLSWNPMTMLIASTTPLAILLLVSMFFTNTSALSLMPKDGLELALIHRSSPESPYYNPNMTQLDLLEETLLTAKARRLYLQQKKLNKSQTTLNSNSDLNSSLVAGKISPFYKDYVIQYYIGTPPELMYAIPDTGSGIIWQQCEPCKKCYKSSTPIFDPTLSSSYKQVLCHTPECTMVPFVDGCSKPGMLPCRYIVSYADGAYSSGVVATETIQLFDDNGKAIVSLPKTVIGCGTYNVGLERAGEPNGVMGLNGEESSLVSQLRVDKFSHCVSNTPPRTIYKSLIKFGSSAVIEEPKTPLVDGPSELYYVQVNDISIDGKRLNIPRWVFTAGRGSGSSFIIDSGTSFSVLDGTAFNMVVNAIKNFMQQRQQYPIKGSFEDFELCYNLVEQAPNITINFEGLDFDIRKENSWEMIKPGEYCLAIMKGDGTSILGMRQMRQVNVGFDLSKKIVSLKSQLCLLYT